jgi:hypothetical protein
MTLISEHENIMVKMIKIHIYVGAIVTYFRNTRTALIKREGFAYISTDRKNRNIPLLSVYIAPVLSHVTEIKYFTCKFNFQSDFSGHGE